MGYNFSAHASTTSAFVDFSNLAITTNGGGSYSAVYYGGNTAAVLDGQISGNTPSAFFDHPIYRSDSLSTGGNTASASWDISGLHTVVDGLAYGSASASESILYRFSGVGDFFISVPYYLTSNSTDARSLVGMEVKTQPAPNVDLSWWSMLPVSTNGADKSGVLSITLSKSDTSTIYGSLILTAFSIANEPPSPPTVSQTPLPAAAPLMLSGLGLFGFAARRRHRKAEAV